ncbi:ComEA family DNA-binding protein [Deinococcus peraridilitoris]|uniref:ComEA family DNA-binding protein n=1 Tax=Deinococcus peraridilitoris TaxID=432329 RepID=UPI001FDF0941|nr:helix-hairpin-helix domain-containing protein [Deinococcus peraridilitoris]
MKFKDHAAGAVLTLAAVCCGGWAVWPHLFPAPQDVQVARHELPSPTPRDVAPEYRHTASVAPLISGRVNVNTASRAQLEALPRIGPALAERLIAGRPYRSLADLDTVKGIGPKLLETLAPLVAF